MSRGRKCSDCAHYDRKPDFGHPTCLDHRPCITRSGYDPTLCDSCDSNRRSWDPISRDLSGWRRELRVYSNHMGGAEFWPFEASFSAFFEVVLASGSESGSHSRGRSPRRGRGSRARSPSPRTRSHAHSSSSRHSRSAHSNSRDRDGRSAASRPRESVRDSPRRSRSPVRKSAGRREHSGSSRAHSGAPTPPTGPAADSPVF